MADQSGLKDQSKAALILVGLAIVAVLGMVILGEFRNQIPLIAPADGTTNVTMQATIDLFIAGLAIFGTFATVTALIIVVKGIIGLVKNMS